MQATKDAPLMDRREAAEWLGVSVATLDRITAPRGPLQCRRVGARSVRFSREDLERYADAVRVELAIER